MNKHSGRFAGVVAAAAVLVVGGALVGPTTAAWAADQINGDSISENSVDQSEIQNGSVTSADVDNGTLTGMDVKNETLTGTDIAAGTVGNSDLADNTITPEKLNQAMLLELVQNNIADANGKANGTWQGATEYVTQGGTVLLVLDVRTTGTEPVRVTVTDHLQQVVAQCIAEPVNGWEGTCSSARVSASSHFYVATEGGQADVAIETLKVG